MVEADLRVVGKQGFGVTESVIRLREPASQQKPVGEIVPGTGGAGIKRGGQTAETGTLGRFAEIEAQAPLIDAGVGKVGPAASGAPNDAQCFVISAALEERVAEIIPGFGIAGGQDRGEETLAFGLVTSAERQQRGGQIGMRFGLIGRRTDRPAEPGFGIGRVQPSRIEKRRLGRQHRQRLARGQHGHNKTAGPARSRAGPAVQKPLPNRFRRP